ncbi:transposable element Tcb1 transposase [Trichonephila clavipes]|uniref:Transposable element Tcb1 transposase n=1 Tax=Trichonephila clavipes TaxID=2585209 RepID=A0A8X6VFT4_TRICX|nr:transposable element Tcb1 transposase [Trichonephila clavipes]
MDAGGNDRPTGPPSCTTARDDMRIVRMTVMDRRATSRTTSQQIQSLTHHSISTRTIRRRLQQSGISARSPLLCLLLSGNHKRLRSKWYNEQRTWTEELNDIVFTDESRFCLQHCDGWIRVWSHSGERLLNCCVMHIATLVLHSASRFGVIELLLSPTCTPDLLPIENVWSMFAQLMGRGTTPTAALDQLWQYVEGTSRERETAVPQRSSKASLILGRGV